MVQDRSRGEGITVLVLNEANIARMFEPGGITFRWMKNVVQEIDHLAVVHVITRAKGYGKGVLEASIGHSVTPAGSRHLQANVRSSDPHAIFVHEGTRPHVIRPSRPLVHNTTGSKKFWDKPTGGLVFFWGRKDAWVRMPIVHHPGIKEPNPFLTDALSEVLRLRGIKKL